MTKPIDYLDHLRHSTAHLLAAAVLELYPEAKRTIGPSIENGFYYDFDFSGCAKQVSESDLPEIESKMHEIAKTWKGFVGREITADEAKLEYKGNPYKVELIEEFSQEGQKLTFYKSGDYEDLCRGGHVLHPSSELKHFKLTHIAGAYWRGSEKNPMLTRIYGTTWPTQKELVDYIEAQEEAKRRDHKILGPLLDLFTFSELVGPGLPLWTPKGTLLRNLLDDFVQELRKEKGYQKVEIPHITKRDLYEKSGHWSKFSNELFKIETREGHEFAMKPMNCPHHTQIFNRKPHSYREMPQRYATTTMVYRDEQSGELSGLSRVRCITQDDAHAFARESQVKEEAFAIWDIIQAFYKGTGFAELKLRLSLHDPEHFEKYLGKKETWIMAENQLREFLKERNADYFEALGEAAFYGPKIDFMSRDSLGREWQLATLQIDRNMPERFSLYCINENGEKEPVVMLHAAIMGSIERFLAILIEHFAGAFPVWLSPVQVQILPITDRNIEYAQKILEKMKNLNIRAEIDTRSETLQSKIRDAQLQKIPYMIIVGDKEEENNTISVRLRTGENEGGSKLEEVVARILETIKTRQLTL